MNWKKNTQIVTGLIVFLILAVLVYDAIAIHFGGTEASISNLIIVKSYEMPFMVFCVGFFIGLLSGHLFWRMKTTDELAKVLKNEKGHGYPSAKDWLKVAAVILTFPVSIPVLIIRDKIKEKENDRRNKN